jgi:NAD(P)-dependent dehydrogenase (short-subunit alcohol dehydrogenase family)
MTKTNKTALVTRASSGLGAELCRLFAADGHDLAVRLRLDWGP